MPKKDLNEKRVAILVDEGFEQVELIKPRKALDRIGATTQVVSPREGEVRGWNVKKWGKSIAVDVPLESADPASFDALLLPGGVMNPDKLRMNPKAVQFVKHFIDAGKPVAAICHGPWTLICRRPAPPAARCVRGNLFPHRPKIVHGPGLQLGAGYRARARIPAEQGFVIAERLHLPGLLIKPHRFEEKIVGGKVGPRRIAAHIESSLPLQKEALIVGLLVFIAEFRKQRPRAVEFLRNVFAELFRQRQQETYERLLIGGIHCKNIQADAFRLQRLIEQPVALGALERGRNRLER